MLHLIVAALGIVLTASIFRPKHATGVDASFVKSIPIHQLVSFDMRREFMSVFHPNMIDSANITPASPQPGPVTADQGASGCRIQFQGRLSF